MYYNNFFIGSAQKHFYFVLVSTSKLSGISVKRKQQENFVDNNCTKRPYNESDDETSDDLMDRTARSGYVYTTSLYQYPKIIKINKLKVNKKYTPVKLIYKVSTFFYKVYFMFQFFI